MVMTPQNCRNPPRISRIILGNLPKINVRKNGNGKTAAKLTQTRSRLSFSGLTLMSNFLEINPGHFVTFQPSGSDFANVPPHIPHAPHVGLGRKNNCKLFATISRLDKNNYAKFLPAKWCPRMQFANFFLPGLRVQRGKMIHQWKKRWQWKIKK